MGLFVGPAVAIGLLALCVASSYEIQEGCRVRERIEEEDFLFDSLDFLAAFPRNQMDLKVLVQCGERSDLIHIRSQGITWTKKQKGKETVEVAGIPPPYNITGWERFTLSLKNKLSLEDKQNHSWAPFDIPLSCHSPEISIIGKHLTRQCSPQTPMWVVQGKEVDIPLYEGIEGVREALTLFSVLPFSPAFNICDASFPLGLQDQKLVTGSMPLEGSAYSLSLSVLPDNTLKVESARELLVSNNLKATPTSMGIRGRDGDRFVVVQHLVSETEDARQPDANGREKGEPCQKPDVITWTLAGTLATMIVAFLVLIIYYLSTRTNKRVRSLRREPTRRQKPVPSYLEPLPAPAAAGPRQTHAHAALPLPRVPSSSPEHLYENPDKASAWKSLYVNEAYGGGDRLGSFSSGSSE